MTGIVDVKITSAHIDGNVVIAISCDAAQSGILIEAIAARRVGNKRKEALRSEVVYPRIGSFGGSDDVFSVSVVKITEFHTLCSFLSGKIPHRYEYII